MAEIKECESYLEIVLSNNVVRLHRRLDMCISELDQNSVHILNAQVSIRAPCCKRWFDCAEVSPKIFSIAKKYNVQKNNLECLLKQEDSWGNSLLGPLARNFVSFL